MKIPDKAFELPLVHRFIFVRKDEPFNLALRVQISGSIKSVKRAYQIAVELCKTDILKRFPEMQGAMCAVFYGPVSDYACDDGKEVFYTTKKFRKRFTLGENDDVWEKETKTYDPEGCF